MGGTDIGSSEIGGTDIGGPALEGTGLEGRTIVVTGVTGQVAEPVAVSTLMLTSRSGGAASRGRRSG